jgi:DnaK suppressor protein
MAVANRERYREELRAMRDRMLAEVNSVVESIREDLNPQGTISNAPVHMADAAPENIESDIQTIETERDVIEQVQAALRRLDDGTFGVCESCGADVGAERLKALPYAAQCIECASLQTTTSKRRLV